ncbi:hypothetical protein HYH02_015119 [Chlamydomonas schloesseri]|uniref:Inward rectifier potassium channel C-terminal domain-containing protein n=1 Tax=Chlamydomonas schloesseri TaxID=2026947 RepID=A0A835VTL7_9CHLO|nr:hypothetical protein HYH02_015119 [Chlamydomonas schloesseri]|eukprot:KAG2424856.1 hypothetical protein HYH02_015119 [Chlamydomonas schloesseri]
MRGDKWTLDRGAGYYAAERERKKLSYLVQTGKHAGRTRVRYVGVGWRSFVAHVLRRDFFTTAVNAKLIHLVAVLVVWYFSMLLGWSTLYYLIWKWNSSCFIGFHGFRSAFMYATETQQTIGYGERATGECWVAALCVSVHSLQAVLLDSVILGIVFSRISHPKQRGRTVLISDCACMARRDGQLKFMFRLADIQRRSVIDPRVRVEMYTWGSGRRTAEGEKIPVIAQELSVSMDRTLLLPVVVEHNVDEASPLFGHTLQSLEAVSAEIVVTFEASSELGDTFMARQSYLPSEIHWGYTFVSIIKPPQPPDETAAEVDLSRFHDVEPQPGLGDELTQPHRLSRRVVAGGSAGSGAVVPGRLLCENTLVLSEDAVVTCRNGRPYLMFRLGDTFPGHVVDVTVTATLYRWHATHTAEGEFLPYEEQVLELEPQHLLLRYPVTLLHELDPATSPVAHWATQKGLRQDADAEVVVMARGTLYSRQEVVTRSRVYSVLGDVKWGHAFLPVVLPGTSATPGGNVTSSKLGAAVDWSHFHSTQPINMPPAPTAPRASPKGNSPRLSSSDGYFAQPGGAGSSGVAHPAATAFASDTAFASAVSTAGAHAAAHAAATVFAPSGIGAASTAAGAGSTYSSGHRGGLGAATSSGMHGSSRLSGIRASHPAPAPPMLRMPSDLSASTGNLAGLMGAAAGGAGGGGSGGGGGGGGMHVGTPFPHHASMALTLPQLHLQREQREQQREQRAQQGEASAGSQGSVAVASAGGGTSAHATAVQQLQRGAGVGMAMAALHRSPSALLLQAGGSEPPAATTAFAAPGAVSFNRRIDDEALSGPASDDHLSGGSPNSTYGSGNVPQQPSSGAYAAQGSGVTGRPGGGGGGGGGITGPRESDRKDIDKSWHQTRSLFAALEGIQEYLQQQEAERLAAEAAGLQPALEPGPAPSGGSGSRPLPPGAFF